MGLRNLFRFKGKKEEQKQVLANMQHNLRIPIISDEEGAYGVYELTQGKLDLDHCRYLFDITVSLLFANDYMNHDMSFARILPSIVGRGDGKLTEEDAQKIYDYVTGRSLKSPTSDIDYDNTTAFGDELSENCEAKDAELVHHAYRDIQLGNLDDAERLLKDVIRNAPINYIYQFEKDGKTFVKFWNDTEFHHFITWQSPTQELVWIRSAYPCAYFYLLTRQLNTRQNIENILQLMYEWNRCEKTKTKSFAETERAVYSTSTEGLDLRCHCGSYWS